MQRTQLLPQTKPDTMSRARAIQLCGMLTTWAQDWRKSSIAPPQPLAGPIGFGAHPAYDLARDEEYAASCAEYDTHGMRHVVLALLRHHPDLLLVEQASQPVARVLSWVLSFTPITTALPTGQLMAVLAKTHRREYTAADGGLCLRAVLGELRDIPGFTALLEVMTLPEETSLRSAAAFGQEDLDSLFGDPRGRHALMGFLAARRERTPPEWPWVLGLLADLDGATDATLSAYGLVTPLHEEESSGGRRKLDASKITAEPSEMATTLVAFLLQLRSVEAPGREHMQWALRDLLQPRGTQATRGNAPAGLHREISQGAFVLPQGAISMEDIEAMGRRWAADREARAAMALHSWRGPGDPHSQGATQGYRETLRGATEPMGLPIIPRAKAEWSEGGHLAGGGRGAALGTAVGAGTDPGTVPAHPQGDPHGAERCQHLWLGDHPDLVSTLPAAIREGLVDAPVLAVLESVEPRLRERPAPPSRRSVGRLLAAAAGAVSGVVRRGSTR